jgi:TPR repeat protein
MMGNCYVSSIGVNKNARLAFLWHRRAMDHGMIHSSDHVMISYRDGEGTEQNLEEYFRIVQSVLAQRPDNYFANLQMGRCYARGIVVEKDWDKAMVYLQKAEWYGDAWYEKGLMYAAGRPDGTGKDDTKALEMFLKGAELHHHESEYEAGLRYLDGIGTEKNRLKAFLMFEAAVPMVPDACYRTAMMLREGVEGRNVGRQAFLNLFRFAAEKGHAAAKAELDKMKAEHP